jgi:hypothetical protein
MLRAHQETHIIAPAENDSDENLCSADEVQPEDVESADVDGLPSSPLQLTQRHEIVPDPRDRDEAVVHDIPEATLSHHNHSCLICERSFVVCQWRSVFVFSFPVSFSASAAEFAFAFAQTPTGLLRHMRWHSSHSDRCTIVRPILCQLLLTSFCVPTSHLVQRSQCSKQFKTGRGLESHMKVHNLNKRSCNLDNSEGVETLT